MNWLKRIGRGIKTVRDKRKAPLRIEFNVTDFCNLNCKGCSHYSPLAPEVYESLERLEESMRRISGARNSREIKDIYLIGGETLLYPRLNEAIAMGRRYFPWAKLSIFTNGLLIPRMNDEFWETCRKYDCVIALTRYPVKFDYDRVEAICREKGVEVEVFGDRSEENSFFKLPLDPEKKQNARLSHFRCIAFGCVTVDGGRIFPCSQSACVGHLNRRFGTDFRWEPGDYIETSELSDVRQIRRLRNRPVPFCSYCRHQTVTKYGPSRRTVDEWT